VIVPDINLLVHAYDRTSPRFDAARRWWESLLNGDEPVGLAWAAILGFIRLTTNRHVLTNPWTAEEACSVVREWLARPMVDLIHPDDHHADTLFRLVASVGTAGNLTTDAHLAALAIEHQAQLHSTDADFGRFPGLRWTNPLAE